MEMNWISVSDRLPPANGHENYIVAVKHYDPRFPYSMITTCEYEARGNFPYWVGYDDGDIRVTHWMPFPEPPENEAPSFVANGEILSVEPNIYDQEERHENCTVQILRNTITGAFSFGWWENGEETS